MVCKHEVGVLLLRMSLGLIFFIHGLVQFQGGLENTTGWFDSISLIGGFALLIGFGTKLISSLFALLMILETLKVKMVVGFLGNWKMNGSELELAFISMSLYLMINGSKLFSLTQLLFKRKNDKDSIERAV